MTNLPEVRICLSAWLVAFNAKDTEGLMSLYDPESACARARTPLMWGVDENRVRYERAFPESTDTLLFKEEGTYQQDSMAMVYGKSYFKPAVDRSEPGTTGRVGLAYRRAEDSSWKLLFDTDKGTPDITSRDFS